MQQTVRLLGELGERYGAEHKYHNLRSPAEAIKLLCINHPEMLQELAHAHEHGVGYRVIQGGTDLGYEELSLPLGANDLILTPVIAGSDDAFTQILVGVGLVAFSFISFGAGIAAGVTGPGGLFGTTAAFASQAALSNAAFVLGAGMLLQGAGSLLSPQPTFQGFGGVTGAITNENLGGTQGVQRATNGVQSYAFAGPGNTVGQGAAIPVIYGEVLAGSHLISSDVDVTSGDSNQITAFVKTPGQSSVRIGGKRPIRSTWPTAEVNRDRTRIQGSVIFKPTVGPKQGRYKSKQKTVNEHITIATGKRYSNFDDDRFGTNDSDDLRDDWVGAMLQLDKGLFEHVSGPGTTKVDGFITYRLEIWRDMEKGPNLMVGASTATIQGLLLDKHNYRWCHLVKSAAVKKADKHFARVYIVDHGVDSSLVKNNFKVVGVGHRIGMNPNI